MSGRPVLVARCENSRWSGEVEIYCPGDLRFGWGQTEAACDTCGARCGIAVAAWDSVERVR